MLEQAGLLRALEAIYGQVSAFSAGLDDDELHRPSRCDGWDVVHVLLHLLGDAQRALISFAVPAGGPADSDFASYWRPLEGADVVEPEDHAEHIRRSVAAYQRPSTVVRQWSETAGAAVWAARCADGSAHVRTQGRTLAIPDFLATLIVEATVHYLDMTQAPAQAPPPDPGGLAVTVTTVDALGGVRAGAWDDPTYALKAAGREALTAAEREELGEAAAAFPVLG